MAKFKVGDRVEHKSSVTGSVADVLPSGNYYVRLDRPAFPGDDCMWPFDERELMPLTPAIPAGWTPASEPPDGWHHTRNMHVLLSSGKEWYGWYSTAHGWLVFPADADVTKIISCQGYTYRAVKSSEVIAWREIEPERDPRVRYVVVAIPTLYDTLEEAELRALRAMESLRVNVVIARVVEEVKPGKPEIIRMEE